MSMLLTAKLALSQTADFNVQHIEEDIGNSGDVISIPTAVSSLNNAFVLANNNRKVSAGPENSTQNYNADDLSGSRVLTGTNTISYYREPSSINTNMKFNSSVWEYVGPSGGDNEMIVRGRYVVTLNGATNSTTQTLTNITNANKCIPFITGITTNVSTQGADSGTAITYLENASTLRVQKGTNANSVDVYITVVEFTGSNWTVLHGDSGNTTDDSGTITLKNNSDATGTTTNVSDWNKSIIFTHHRGDNTSNGTNDAIADNWPLVKPSSNNQDVNWSFDAQHDSNGTNRQFIHVLSNPNLNVTRYQNTSNSEGETSIDITSAGLTEVNEALIIGNSITNGTGTAYGRGWRNYYLKSTTQATHWSHRSGNTMKHEIQIVDLAGLNSPICSASGNILLERYDGVSGTTIANLIAEPNYPNSPTETSYLTSFEIPSNIADNYGVRIRGTICAPETGTYYFWISGDDNVELNISTDNTEANKVKIAYHNNWTSSREWNKYSSQKSAGIVLTSGQSYYIEALMKEGGGGDNLAVGWRKPSNGNAASPIEVIPGSYLSPPVILPATSEINIVGNANTINNGDNAPSITDDTDYGSTDLGTKTSRTFTIESTGTKPLDVSSITLSNTTDFSIVGTPFSSPIPIDESTTFTIEFNSLTQGITSTLITIANDDPNEAPFEFLIQAEAVTNFFDSDGDGVFDNVDIDDDNDGIEDSIEELACKNSNISVTTNYKFLNETFGEGNRAEINTNYDAITTYCYEDGVSSGCFGGIDLNDGEYTVYYRASNDDGNNDTPFEELGSWADEYWYAGRDHTPGDTNGRMAMFNAAIDPGIFYTANISGALPNVPVTYSFWVLNLDRTDAPDIETRLRPNIRVEFRDVNDNILETIITNDIPPTTAGNLDGDWYNFTAELTFPVSEFNVYFFNNQLGGLGNDLAIDDINIIQTLCDTDADGVADLFDLDSDNDGIPDIVEAGFASISNGKATIDNFYDGNGNGMHDAFEGLPLLDSDSDGTPNFIDLDSDNDSIFDVDESGAGNSANPDYQNGDGDINGDGVGDGPDSDSVREKDFNSDGSSEFFTDGILDIYDYFNGNTMATAYGNSNQGNGNTYFVVDTDNDGLPDYIDTYNNISETYDISQTLYANLDSNNDGVIDDTNDTDGDGILDLFDTNDSVFGSPRDLDQKLQLYFDGRNDYIQDNSIISSWSEISMMGWIKIDPTGHNTRTIFGQDNFSLKILSDEKLSIEASGTTIIYNTELPVNQWVHVGAIYSSSSEKLSLFVNGEPVESTPKSGALNSDSNLFTIGRTASSNSNFFKGVIDEVRLFDKALSEDEFQKIVYQEIENNDNVRGVEIPRDVSTLSWSNLIRYYRLDNYKNDITDDLTTPSIDINNGAKLYNIKTIKYQSAPMPFISQESNTSLPNALTIETDGVNGNDAITYDWSIVKIEHDGITFNNNQRHLGLFVNKEDSDSNQIKYSVTDDSELNVSWHLKLDGFIDLEGQSQLVQGDDSELIVTSTGQLERDQQGTADTYTYNYWSSPVGQTDMETNEFSYNLSNVIQNIGFLTSGYNGSASPLKIADYWVWKFSNLTSGDYSAWQQTRSTGNIFAGEGFTMKGPGSGSLTSNQNYIFKGKPNNGDINLEIFPGNNYLIGNPYPSAIDAVEFIKDNIGTITGTLYFWEHWGGGNHVLSDYQGGYAQMNLSGGTPSVTKGQPVAGVSNTGTARKTPGRYIPVSQGFFVLGNAGGSIHFKNEQRKFQIEDNTLNGSSVFIRNSEATANEEDIETSGDPRMKFRIGIYTVNTIQRQLLLTIDPNATTAVDLGYDGILNEFQVDDMFWMIDGDKYIIQGSNDVEIDTTYPIGIKTGTEGVNTISINGLENVPDSMDIFIHDIQNDTYHNLRESDYEINLSAGEHLNRFEMTFRNTNDTLHIDDNELQTLDMYYSNETKALVLLNPNYKTVKSIEIFNIVGQSIYTINDISELDYSEYEVKNLSAGTYIIKTNTVSGSVSKKVLVEQ